MALHVGDTKAETDPDGQATPEPTGRWVFGSGTWEFRVERLFLIVGFAVMLAFGGWWMIADGAAFGLASAFGLLLLAGVGGWGLARWFGGRRHPQPQVAWFGSAILIGFVVFPLMRWLLTHLAPSAFALGSIERLMIAPAVVAVVMIVAGKLALHLNVSRIAALFVVGALFATDDLGDWPRERVSTATTAQLQFAAESGDAVLIRGIDHDEGAGITGKRPQGATDCQRLSFADKRRTLMGLNGRRVDLRVDACWAGDGKPISLTVINHQDKGNERGEVRAVRLNPVDGFSQLSDGIRPPMVDIDGAVPASLRYGDHKADLAPGPRGSGSELTLRNADGKIWSDGNPVNDTVIARVRERGNSVEVIVAFESADLFVRRPEDTNQNGTNQNGTDTWSPDRVAVTRPRLGYARDVVLARLYRDGHSNAAYLLRTTSSGVEIGWSWAD